MANRSIHKIHWLWSIPAGIAMIALLSSDAANNLSIVHLFASGMLSLISWQTLAVGCALASAPLGFAASRHKMYWAPCILVAVISGILTLLSTNTDFSDRSVNAKVSTASIDGMIKERDDLQAALPECRRQRWCSSQSSSRRIAQLNYNISKATAKVDPLSTPNGALYAQIVAFMRAFGVPLLVAALGNVIGLSFPQGFRPAKKSQAPTDKGNSTEKGRKISGSIPSVPGIKTRPESLKFNAPMAQEPDLEASMKMAKKWLATQPEGRINKDNLRVAANARRKGMKSVIDLLIVSGHLRRMTNGQLSKPAKKSPMLSAVPNNIVKFKPKQGG